MEVDTWSESSMPPSALDQVLSSLNAGQREAIQVTSGPVMILAGAGSGKTRTLVAKISYLLQEGGVSQYQFLALTFSNKAAQEMRHRLLQYLGLHEADYRSLPTLSTFHSFCAQVLRQQYKVLGLTQQFSIYDDGDSESLVKNLLSRRGLTTKQIAPKTILYYIEQLKNRGYFLGIEHQDHPLAQKIIQECQYIVKDSLYSYFVDYEKELLLSNAVDFSGLITGVIQLFVKNQTVLEYYQDRYKYILVDEYQDTNRSQFILLSILANRAKHLCVVGDEDQSIYSWRGADIKNILDFESQFPNYKLIKLEQNYRSTSNIINAATAVIENNDMRKGKKLWTSNPSGDLVSFITTKDDIQEAASIISRVQQLRDKGASYQDMAIFYRSNASSRLLEDELRRKKIPYRIVGGMRFYDRKEVKDMLAYMRLIINPSDSQSLSRIINVPARGLGATTLKKIETQASEQEISFFQAIQWSVQAAGLLKLSKKVQESLKSFTQNLEEWRKSASETLPSLLYQRVLRESGYHDDLLQVKDKDTQDRWQNLEQLYNAFVNYEKFAQQVEVHPTLEGFLESITLDHTQQQEELGVISLMTVHASKGLEFDYVFMAGADEGVFPSYQSIERGDQAVEEERRLFYVAMTRACKRLWIYHAKGRMLWGQVRFYEPSRYVTEIPTNYLSQEQEFQGRKVQQQYDDHDQRTPENYITIQVDKNHTFHKNQIVEHNIYGQGQVIGSEGSGEEEKVMVKFMNGALKKFMVKFAHLKILSSEV
jgi:DNA helicase-2/ATP-dependent DNA helicase PcrA